LPVEKGFDLNQDDLMRRQIIMDMMCSTGVNFKAVEGQFGISFADYFDAEMKQMQAYATQGLVGINDAGIHVLPKGRLFVRAFGMAFDGYLAKQTTANYSRLI